MKRLRRMLRPGYSLMEIVIVLAIIGILLGVGVPMLMNRLDESRKSTAKLTLHGYKQAINTFYADTGSYPQELQDLMEKPSDERIAAKWASPYMEKLSDDPWNHELHYERTPGGEHPYDLYSYGPNGEDAPEEEHISVWE